MNGESLVNLLCQKVKYQPEMTVLVLKWYIGRTKTALAAKRANFFEMFWIFHCDVI